MRLPACANCPTGDLYLTVAGRIADPASGQLLGSLGISVNARVLNDPVLSLAPAAEDADWELFGAPLPPERTFPAAEVAFAGVVAAAFGTVFGTLFARGGADPGTRVRPKHEVPRASALAP